VSVREATDSRATTPRLGELLRRLISEIRILIDQRVTVLRVELKEQLAAMARDLILMAVGIGLVAIASLLLITALALWVGRAIGSMAGGFGVLGAAALVLGGVLMGVAMTEFRRRRLAPKTREELRRDVEWLKTVT
jgi:uncharacterized membrane protein YqjE